MAHDQATGRSRDGYGRVADPDGGAETLEFVLADGFGADLLAKLKATGKSVNVLVKEATSKDRDKHRADAVPAMPKKVGKWPIEFVRSLGERSIACKFVSPNPKRAYGPQSANKKKDYDRYMGATTVRDFFASGGTAEDLRSDVASSFCTLDESALPAAWLEYVRSHDSADLSAWDKKIADLKKALAEKRGILAELLSRVAALEAAGSA